MSCSTAGTSAFSLPAAAVDSCWSDGPMASLHHPGHPAGAMGMVRDCWPSLQGAAALGAFIPCTSLCPSACMLSFLSSASRPSPTSKLLLLYHHREPSCPAASLLLRPRWGGGAPALCGRGPQHPLSRRAASLSPPRAARWAGSKRVPEGGCTSPDPLQLIPSDRTSS